STLISSLFIPPQHLHPLSTLFPYTTLFRSSLGSNQGLVRLIGTIPILRPAAELIRDVLPRDGEAEVDRHIVGEFRMEQLCAFHRSEEHTSELQSRFDLVCRLLLEKKN